MNIDSETLAMQEAALKALQRATHAFEKDGSNESCFMLTSCLQTWALVRLAVELSSVRVLLENVELIECAAPTGKDNGQKGGPHEP